MSELKKIYCNDDNDVDFFKENSFYQIISTQYNLNMVCIFIGMMENIHKDVVMFKTIMTNGDNNVGVIVGDICRWELGLNDAEIILLEDENIINNIDNIDNIK